MCELGMYFGRIYKVVIRLRMLKKLCWRVGALAHTQALSFRYFYLLLSRLPKSRLYVK